MPSDKEDLALLQGAGFIISLAFWELSGDIRNVMKECCATHICDNPEGFETGTVDWAIDFLEWETKIN